MNPSEISAIRSRLRDVNVEYSALVRDKSGKSPFARMGQLGTERRVLMGLLAGRQKSGTDGFHHVIRRQQPIDAARQPAT